MSSGWAGNSTLFLHMTCEVQVLNLERRHSMRNSPYAVESAPENVFGDVMDGDWEKLRQATVQS